MGDHARITLRPRRLAVCSGPRRPPRGDTRGEGPVGWVKRPAKDRSADPAPMWVSLTLHPPYPADFHESQWRRRRLVGRQVLHRVDRGGVLANLEMKLRVCGVAGLSGFQDHLPLVNLVVALYQEFA